MGHAGSSEAHGGAGVRIRPWDEAYRALVSDRDVTGPVRRRRRFRRTRPARAPTGEQVLVAFAGEQIVGFVLARPSPDEDRHAGEAEVVALYVDPDLRDEGVGGALLDNLLERLKQAGLQAATVWLPAEAAGVRRFYDVRKWAPDAASRMHPVSGAAEVRYRIAL